MCRDVRGISRIQPRCWQRPFDASDGVWLPRIEARRPLVPMRRALARSAGTRRDRTRRTGGHTRANARHRTTGTAATARDSLSCHPPSIIMPTPQPNNPLHGLTLETILTQLVEHYGWDELGMMIDIR